MVVSFDGVATDGGKTASRSGSGSSPRMGGSPLITIAERRRTVDTELRGEVRAPNPPMSSHEYPDGLEGEVELIELTSWTVESVGRPAECTLFPRAVGSRDRQMSAWMTAVGDSFVDCQEMR
jgi:hypothetical protein